MLDLNVIDIDRRSVKLPLREIPARNMVRELPHWDIFEIIKVTLHGGVVGYGETFTYYTWRQTDDEAVRRAWGKNAAQIMWDDSMGAGLQMALFDAVAKAAGVPIHALLGTKTRDRAAISWWDYDLPPADLAAECKLAAENGYTSFKTKARPWWDIYDQMTQVSNATPRDFQMDLDFNSMLLNADHAERLLPDLAAKFPMIAIYETPIPQQDAAGGKRIQQVTNVPIAHHYGSPSIIVQLKEELCDGFVVGGSARRIMQQGAVCAAVKKPFWLQQVGTGLTAAFSLHFAAVLEEAKWPAVNCHQLYENDLMKTTLVVEDGMAEIPDAPGLGIEIDLDAINEYRIEPPKAKPMGPDRLMRVIFSSGETWCYAYGRQYVEHALRGGMPVYEKGVRLETAPNDGSSRWRELHQRALKGPVRE